VATFQFARANGQEYLPGTVGAGKGEAAVQILHFLPAPQAPPGLGRAQRHFVEKRFDGAAKRLVDFELVGDRHLGNSAVSVTNMVRCSHLRLAGRRGAHCAKVRQQGIRVGRSVKVSKRMRKERKHHSAYERCHFEPSSWDEVPASDLCEETGLRPTVFYRTQNEFFANVSVADT
jgi:hypothetical protein